MITAERLREVVSYDPDAGRFVWLKRISIRIMPGREAGSVNHAGYIMIRIDGELVMAHRLAWLYMTGALPEAAIDHINCVKSDNRFCNLREASAQENHWNTKRPKTNTSGAKGVHWDSERNMWAAFIKIDGRQTFLGRFRSLEEGADAYARAARLTRGEFARAA